MPLFYVLERLKITGDHMSYALEHEEGKICMLCYQAEGRPKTMTTRTAKRRF